MADTTFIDYSTPIVASWLNDVNAWTYKDTIPINRGGTGATTAAAALAALGGAPIISPALTGTPTVPTAAVDTNTDQIASTSYVINQGYLKAATASATYLTQANAASTYLNKATPTLTGALNEAPAVSLAVASTVNIGAAGSNHILLTGTGTISAFDNFPEGAIRRLYVGSSTTIFTANSAIQLPTGASIYGQSGDILVFRSKGAGTWELLSIQRQRSLARVVAYMTSVTTLASPLTYYPVKFNEVYIDRLSEHNKTTYTTTIKEAGDYNIFAQAMFSLGNVGDWGELAIHINGSRKARGRSSVSDASTAWVSTSVFDSYNLVAGDTVQIYAQYGSSNNDRNIQTTGDKELTRLIIEKKG